MTLRLLLVAPGRGSYTRRELGAIARLHAATPAGRERLAAADALRRKAGAPTISELDAAESYKASLHQAGEHASALIYTASALDRLAIDELEAQGQAKTVACIGNSMGWYSALHLGDVLDFEDAFTLVDEMGRRQEGRVLGGQILYPVVDEDWRHDADREAEVLARLADAQQRGEELWLSIRLGGSLVIAGADAALDAFSRNLPPVELGRHRYPMKLLLHSAFHTPLMADASRFATALIARLRWRAPRVPLIDGRGRIHHRGAQTDLRELSAWTGGAQVTDTFDFTAAVRVALREFNPDRVVLLGPGSTLGSALARVMIAEGWRGIRSRADFEAAQSGKDRPLVAMGLEDQRRDLLEAS